MDVFAFASQSETQGMVVAEAMAAGVPVVAMDAPGIRDVVEDGSNGRLLSQEDEQAFAAALEEVASAGGRGRHALQESALATAEELSIDHCAERVLAVYQSLQSAEYHVHEVEGGVWAQTLRLLEAEWHLFRARLGAAVKAITTSLSA